MTTPHHMTLEELKQFIEITVDTRLKQIFGEFELAEDILGEDEDTRTWEEVKADIEKHRWTPPPGAKSSLELLREDRDR